MTNDARCARMTRSPTASFMKRACGPRVLAPQAPSFVIGSKT
jgi:hypothetical protein